MCAVIELESPASCITHTGPHSVDCLNELWLEQECLTAGTGYPDTAGVGVYVSQSIT